MLALALPHILTSSRTPVIGLWQHLEDLEVVAEDVGHKSMARPYNVAWNLVLDLKWKLTGLTAIWRSETEQGTASFTYRNESRAIH
jgi:hypothetical protein